MLAPVDRFSATCDVQSGQPTKTCCADALAPGLQRAGIIAPPGLVLGSDVASPPGLEKLPGPPPLPGLPLAHAFVRSPEFAACADEDTSQQKLFSKDSPVIQFERKISDMGPAESDTSSGATGFDDYASDSNDGSSTNDDSCLLTDAAVSNLRSDAPTFVPLDMQCDQNAVPHATLPEGYEGRTDERAMFMAAWNDQTWRAQLGSVAHGNHYALSTLSATGAGMPASLQVNGASSPFRVAPGKSWGAAAREAMGVPLPGKQVQCRSLDSNAISTKSWAAVLREAVATAS
eukprot:TRINITY_DN60205_c0_g1_i1.p1 TRINITY_DN60205_c0_g1~~TRINITY_DN60205_c0_g1_i1.p1  ORF type:complete len:289 (-),score=58.28 TRINITY_DN60205_c0_g1_i1:105-971(-)